MASPVQIISLYGHYIPRFLLHNFGFLPDRSRPDGQKRPIKTSQLNSLNLETGKLELRDASRTFGCQDMYRNHDANVHEQQNLEKKLSTLEQSAKVIFAQIQKQFKANKTKPKSKQLQVHLMRGEKDLLRRFLFLMLYRNRTFQNRFKESTDDYTSNDRAQMLAYMKEKGFSKPKDVWFSNMHTFLNIDLAKDFTEWSADLRKQAYPPDAQWFFKNMQASFVSICTPEDEDDEFLMTQNAYSIYEGPCSTFGWSDYDVFAPVSSQIMIVSRSNILSTGNEEDDRAKIWPYELLKRMMPFHANAESIFHDLPVKLPLNNYSTVVNGKVTLNTTKIAFEKHRFRFSFFPISTRHVQLINMVFLEQALGTEAIIYKTPSAFKRALDFYLADTTEGFKLIPNVSPEVKAALGLDWESVIKKTIVDWPGNARERYLGLLERIARNELGS